MMLYSTAECEAIHRFIDNLTVVDVRTILSDSDVQAHGKENDEVELTFDIFRFRDGLKKRCV